MAQMNGVYAIKTVEDLLKLGSRVAHHVRSGDAVFLSGPMGAGKTTLSSSIGKALGVSETLTSPTFAIATESHAENSQLITRVVHIDLYRIGEGGSWDDTTRAMLSDVFQMENRRGTVVIVEWAELLPKTVGIDGHVVQIHIDLDPDRTGRMVTISGFQE